MKILIAMPSLTGQIPLKLVQTILTFQRKPEWHIDFAYTERVLIDVARNASSEIALNQGFDYIFFMDDDTVPPTDILMKMMELDKDIVVAPVADRNGEPTVALFDNKLTKLQSCQETKEVEAGGMSCTLIKCGVLAKVAKTFGVPFRFEEREVFGEYQSLGEDVNFCLRAKELGFSTWAIPMQVWHIGRHLSYGYDPEKDQIMNTFL